MIAINELAKKCHRIAKEKGWWEVNSITKTTRQFPEVVALMHSELSEALEEHRNGHGQTEIYYLPSNQTKPEGVPIELADLVIRLLDWCEANNIDLEQALAIKIQYNETRPYRHGGKTA